MLLVLTYINNTSCKSAVRSLNDFIAYGQSKLANILHTNELSRIFKVSQVLSTLHTKECLMTEETMSIA
jgi:N-glycosylase/DNA lyase